MQFLQSVTDWDISVLLFIQNHLRFDAATTFWRLITFFGKDGWFFITLTLCLLIFKKTRKAGLMSAVSMAVVFTVCNLLIKPAAARIRPYDLYSELILLVPPEKSFSFPSGHTANSFSSALILVRMLPKKAGVPLVILCVLIGLSRLYVAVHYPTDVICGFLIALILSTIVYHIMKRILHLNDTPAA